MQRKELIIWRNVFILCGINHERHDLTASDSSHRRSGSVMDVISHFCSVSGHYEARNHHVVKGQKVQIQ
jgi:hypothetical protein